MWKFLLSSHDKKISAKWRVKKLKSQISLKSFLCCIEKVINFKMKWKEEKKSQKNQDLKVEICWRNKMMVFDYYTQYNKIPHGWHGQEWK